MHTHRRLRDLQDPTDLTHREIFQVVKSETLRLSSRKTPQHREKAVVDRLRARRLPFVATPPPRQRSRLARAATKRRRGQIHQDPPYPCTRIVIGADPLPMLERPDERFLRKLLTDVSPTGERHPEPHD